MAVIFRPSSSTALKTDTTHSSKVSTADGIGIDRSEKIPLELNDIYMLLHTHFS